MSNYPANDITFNRISSRAADVTNMTAAELTHAQEEIEYDLDSLILRQDNNISRDINRAVRRDIGTTLFFETINNRSYRIYKAHGAYYAKEDRIYTTPILISKTEKGIDAALDILRLITAKRV